MSYITSGFSKSINRSELLHNLEYKPIQKSVSSRTEEEMIERISGGDKTRGSCSSVAFAYIGNKAGYDVLDFRGGNSRTYFSMDDTIAEIAHFKDVESQIIYGKDDFDCANQLLNSMIPGKQYYLATGEHAAIVRSNGDYFEYLELQSSRHDNKWYFLDDYELSQRFFCSVQDKEYPNVLIDIESLARSEEFIDIIGFLNTDECKQRKGANGHVK